MFKKDPNSAIDTVMGIKLTPTYEYLIEALEALMNSVNKNSRYCVRIAYRLHHLMNDSNYAGIDSNIKDRYVALKNGLPKGTQALYWDPWVRIKNVKYKEGLYESKYMFDESRKYVFTAIHSSEVYPVFEHSAEQYRWKVSTSDCGKTFKFKNFYYNRTLYRSVNQYNDNRQKVYDWREDREVANDNWKLYPQSDGESYIISTGEQDEDLFVGAFTYSSESREVYAWKGDTGTWNDADENKKRLWIIE